MLDQILDEKPKKKHKKPGPKKKHGNCKMSPSTMNKRRRAKENPNRNPVGRPTRDDKKRMPKLIKLLPDSWREIKKVGDGSFTRGIDLILQEYRIRRML